MSQCLIGLGSNLGERSALLNTAIARLDALQQTHVIARSRFHETPPIGGPADQEPFLNAAVLLETSLPSHGLLDETRRIEDDLGRLRVDRWGPRPIDLDLLLYDDLVVESHHLQLPHPRMAWRRFVLAPSVEVAAEMRHPRIGWTVRQLFDHLQTATPYIALAGLPGAGKTTLAQAAAERLGGTVIPDPAALKTTQPEQDNSYGFDLEAEIECAKQRTDALSIASPIWHDGSRFWISDFWMGCSVAAIQMLSEEPLRDELLQRSHGINQQVCPPKLTALLDAPAHWCIRQLAGRGQQEPDAAMLQKTETLREAIAKQVDQLGAGPVLKLDAQHPADALEELVAAVVAMES